MEQIHTPACLQHRGWFILINDEGFDLYDPDKVQTDFEGTTLQEIKSFIDKKEDEAIEKYSDINDSDYYRGRADRDSDNL